MKILRKFTIDDKLKCIEMVTKMGYQKVSELTGIDRKSLRESVYSSTKKPRRPEDAAVQFFRLCVSVITYEDREP